MDGRTARAGVLPRVIQGALEDDPQGRVEGLERVERQWSVVKMVPGRYPLLAMSAALGPYLMDTPTSEKLQQRLEGEPERVARELCEQLGRNRGLLLLVDQLEELFTQGEAVEVEPMGRCLGALIAHAMGGLRLIVTVRGDFLTRLAALPEIGAEVTHALYLLRPLGPEAVRKAVVEPARQQGVHFESEAMVRELVDAIANHPSGLPLLEFTLGQLWEARDEQRKMIPAAALAELGGVAGSLGRHGQGVLASLGPADRVAARRILLRLVSAEGTRRRVSRDELGGDDDGEAKAALDALVRGRLVAATETPEGAAYELAHEALIEGWDTLRTWLDEDRGQRPVRERMAVAAAEWERLGRTREALWAGRQLKEARALASPDLGTRERAFLEASEVAARRRLAVGVWGIILLVGGLGGIARRAYTPAGRAGLVQDRDKKGSGDFIPGTSPDDGGTR